MREYFVYILASHPFGTLYIGVTNDIARRVAEHRSRAVPSFTRRYAVHRLVHVERFTDPESAIRREKRLKRWPRDWKLELIKRGNPGWRDLAGEP